MRRGMRMVAVVAALALAAGSGCAAPGRGTKQTKAREATRTVPATASVAPTASTEPTIVATGKDDIAVLVEKSPGLSTFERVVKASGIRPALQGKRTLTLLAPDDAAFSLLGTATVDRICGDRAKAARLVRAHLIMGRVPVDQMVTIRRVMTFEGARWPVSEEATRVLIDHKAEIVKRDVRAKNGLVQVTDVVLLPKGFAP